MERWRWRGGGERVLKESHRCNRKQTMERTGQRYIRRCAAHVHSRLFLSAPALPNYEKRNAIIYHAYVRKEYDKCEVRCYPKVRVLRVVVSKI